jgi:hypothetical protein
VTDHGERLGHPVAEAERSRDDERGDVVVVGDDGVHAALHPVADRPQRVLFADEGARCQWSAGQLHEDLLRQAEAIVGERAHTRVGRPCEGDRGAATPHQVLHLQPGSLVEAQVLADRGRSAPGDEGDRAGGLDRGELRVGHGCEREDDVGIERLPQRRGMTVGVRRHRDESVSGAVEHERGLIEVRLHRVVERPVRQYQQHDVAASARQGTRRAVRPVSQALRLIQHPAGGGLGDRLTGGVVEDEADRRARDAQRTGDVGGGHTPGASGLLRHGAPVCPQILSATVQPDIWHGPTTGTATLRVPCVHTGGPKRAEASDLSEASDAGRMPGTGLVPDGLTRGAGSAAATPPAGWGRSPLPPRAPGCARRSALRSTARCHRARPCACRAGRRGRGG